MSAGQKVLIGLRVLILVTAFVVIGLGAWSKTIIYDVEIQGSAALRNAQLGSRDRETSWEVFFITIAEGSVRIWITIVAACFALFISLLVLLSTIFRKLDMPNSVRIPLELLSACAMATAFGCTLSLALSLHPYSNILPSAISSADLAMFATIIPLSIGFAVTTGTGLLLVTSTTLTATIQTCLRPKVQEMCSFEPSASALGMGPYYETIAPQTLRSRPPTMYDPRKPLPKELERMPDTDEEMALAENGFGMSRVDSGLSVESKELKDVEKEADAWPLAQDEPRVLQIRPSRLWSEVPQEKKRCSAHAI